MIEKGDIVYLISEKHSYVVGRKNVDVVLENDTSVSRKHSTIYIANKNKCKHSVSTSTGIWIIDENSKYGTYLRNNKNEWEKLNGGEEIPLSHGSIIRFGLMDNLWSLKYVPVIACTSGIQSDAKKKIANFLKSVDGELINSWSNECNLTIVSEITLTVKVVLSLINGVPIVKIDYLNKLIEAIRNKMPLPDYKDYRPVISESVLDSSLVSLDPGVTRKELFKGKHFYFPTMKQLETLKEVIVSAGGKASILNPDWDWKKLSYDNVIVVQLPSNKINLPQGLNEKFQKINDYLKESHGKRIIPESEIAQAVAYSSTDKYCNPIINAFERTSSVEETQDMGVILAEETPETTDNIILQPCIIPSSMTGDTQEDLLLNRLAFQPGLKRGLSPDSDEPRAKVARSEKVKSSKKEIQTGGGKTLFKNSSIINYFRKEGKKIDGKQECAETDISKKNDKVIDVEIDFKNDLGRQKDKRKKSSVGLTDIDHDFWDSTPSCESHTNKRKHKEVTASTRLEESNESKKMKLPADIGDVKECRKQEPSKGVEPHRQKPIESKSKSWQPESVDDFMELDKTVCNSTLTLNQCDVSIFSLDLISTLYLNDDGSLKDPPDVPVNVKKFKKHKGKMRDIDRPELEDDLSGDGWLEVHPLNTSNGSIDGKYAW